MSPNSNTLPSSRHLQRKRKYLSDEGGDFSDDDSGSSPKSSSDLGEHDRRHHHNMLERRRRDHIKDHFSSLKNAIPLLEGEKSSRALILKRAVDYIQVLQSQLKEAKLEIDDYKRRNNENNFRQNSITTAVFNGLLPQQQQPHQQQQTQQPHSLIHSIPSVSTAFMNLPSTSVIQQQQQQPTLFPSIVSECLQPLSASSPLTVVTPTNYTSTLPLQLPQSLQHHQQHHQQQQQQQQASDSTKNALLTQLLQLIQAPLPPPPPPPPSTTISTTLPHISLSSTDFNNNQQLFAFHERQLSSAVQL